MVKIIVFIGGYLPGQKYGGPVTSIFNFTEYMGDDSDIKIVCYDHDFNSIDRYPNIVEGWNRVGKAKVKYIKKNEANKKKFTQILQESGADVIYLSSIFHVAFSISVIKAAKFLRIPVLLSPRGELTNGALKIKRTKKRVFLCVMKFFKFYEEVFFQGTSEEEVKNISKYLGVKKNKIFYLSNFPSNIEKPINIEKIENQLKILFISRIHPKKNLQFAIKIVKQLEGEVSFDIFGPIEDKEYWDNCVNEIENTPKNISINYCGALDMINAKKVYTKYDCLLFPTLSENYGHVIAEAINSGCPIVISANVTPWDDINNQGGFVIPLEYEEQFVFTLNSLSKMDKKEYQEVRNKLLDYRKRKISISRLKSDYNNTFQKIISEWLE